jgi:two-component system sensor histidine kinase MprB
VSNRVENAAKFDGTGPVEVRVDRGRVTVSDRGPGIAPADAERVFDRSYRADTARGLPGSGLGPAIIRDVADAQITGSSCRRCRHHCCRAGRGAAGPRPC